MCSGGLDLNPQYLPCGYGGLLFGLLTFKTVLLAIGAAAVLYYGWPIIEKILLVLPIPDPKSIKEKFTGMLQSSTNVIRGKGNNNTASGYSGIGKPVESLSEEDDEEDNLGGSTLNGSGSSNGTHTKKGLNYDSDEDKEDNELITLDKDTVSRDRTNTAADKIPKLSKPQTQ